MGRARYKSILNPLTPYRGYPKQQKHVPGEAPSVEVDTSLAIRNAADRVGFAWVNTGTNTYATKDMANHQDHFFAFSTKQEVPVDAGLTGYVMTLNRAPNGSGDRCGIAYIGYSEKNSRAECQWQLTTGTLLQTLNVPDDGVDHFFVFGVRYNSETSEYEFYGIMDGVEASVTVRSEAQVYNNYNNVFSFHSVGAPMINTDIFGPAMFDGRCTEADAQNIMASGYGAIQQTCLLGWEVPADSFNANGAIPNSTELPDRADETKGWSNSAESWMSSADARTKVGPYE